MTLTFPISLLFLFPFLLILIPPAASSAPEATLAIHITLTQSNSHLLPRLLTRLYDPQNIYLIETPYLPLPSLPSHSHLENIHIRQSQPCTPNGASSTLNLLEGMSYFLDQSDLQSHHFDYYIHLTPSEYPTLTALNLRKALYLPSNKPSPIFFNILPDSHRDEIDKLFFDFALSFTANQSKTLALHSTKLSHPGVYHRKWSIPRSDPFFILSARFVQRAVDSMLAKKLLMTLAEASHVSERFFPALAVNDPEMNAVLVRNSSLRCRDVRQRELGEGEEADVAFLRDGICLFAAVSEEVDIRDAIDTVLHVEDPFYQQVSEKVKGLAMSTKVRNI